VSDLFRTKPVQTRYCRAFRHTDAKGDNYIVQDTDKNGKPLATTVRTIAADVFAIEYENVLRQHKTPKKESVT
jgi:hypothetical protein